MARNLDLQNILDTTAPPGFSTEVEEDGPEEMLDAPMAEESVVDMDSVDEGEADEDAKAALAALYGEDFPYNKDEEPTEDDWVKWAKSLWGRHGPSVEKRLHIVERNRLFRKGVQWITASGGKWREPPKPKDAARIVRNRIAPALDMRAQLISEQRPGFSITPVNNDATKKRRAEAQTNALEYQYDQQKVSAMQQEAFYWAGTDGVAFIELFWNPERGPWHEVGSEEKEPLGDIDWRIRRMEQVRVSPEATASHSPWYWVLRDTMSLQEAVKVYGPEVAKEPNPERDYSQNMGTPSVRLGQLLPHDDDMLLEQNTVDRITVYCERSEYLPTGLMMIVVGDKLVVPPLPLPIGRVPIVRFTDGTTDPRFFPQAIMEGWIDSQMRINALLSKWYENIRLNAGPRLLTRPGSIVGETLVAGTMSVVEVKGLGGIADSVRPLDGFSLAPDVEKAINMEMKTFDDLSGDNDVSRGVLQGDRQSGKSLLAAREQLERTFAPIIVAAAAAMTEWAKITLGFMAWGYDIPRNIGIQGNSRKDLASAISAEDFDGVADVYVDPETMMPMPRTMKLFLLQQMLEQQQITPQEYRRRMPFSYIREIDSPDEDQSARAHRVAQAIKESGNGMALPVLWQDNEAIHQDVLERDLILPDDLDPAIRSAAFDRWMMLAQQSAMKMAGMPPGPGNMPSQGQPEPSAPAQNPTSVAPGDTQLENEFDQFGQ